MTPAAGDPYDFTGLEYDPKIGGYVAATRATAHSDWRRDRDASAAHTIRRTEHGHDPHLGHHFDTPEQQFESGKLGMWIFLATEILLFGGLFCAYAVYRSNHPEIFVYAHRFLDKTLGGLNTLVLICSSFTMAWAVRAAQLGERRKLDRPARCDTALSPAASSASRASSTSTSGSTGCCGASGTTRTP